MSKKARSVFHRVYCVCNLNGVAFGESTLNNDCTLGGQASISKSNEACALFPFSLLLITHQNDYLSSFANTLLDLSKCRLHTISFFTLDAF